MVVTRLFQRRADDWHAQSHSDLAVAYILTRYLTGTICTGFIKSACGRIPLARLSAPPPFWHADAEVYQSEAAG